LSACEGRMHHKGQEDWSRKLAWVEGQKVAGWGCSNCAWVFHPFDCPTGDTLDEWAAYAQRQLDNDFDSHNCAEHPRREAAAS
jgi:hypothetical protein